MTAPYTPTAFSSPIVSPQVGGSGAPPIPYISNSVFLFAPTSVDAKTLNAYGIAGNTQALADTIRRASKWVDNICYGADAAAKGSSLAASLSVESTYTSVKNGQLRLICDYRPIIEVVGIDVGADPSSTASIGSTLAAASIVQRRTIVVPYIMGYVGGRPNDTGVFIPNGAAGRLYAVWSYVNGYPHTKLVANVAQGATSCVVQSTDGNGGLWGVFAASGAFPGTALQVSDGDSTERVFAQSIQTDSPAPGQTTLTTSPFANAHTVPPSPDFLPVSGIPDDVQEACIALTMMLAKLRGTRANILPMEPGGTPSRQALGRAGALEDWEVANHLLVPYVIRMKAKN